MKTNNAIDIFTLSIYSIKEHVANQLYCIFDVIIEMRLEDKINKNNINSISYPSSPVLIKIRILSIKNIGYS